MDHNGTFQDAAKQGQSGTADISDLTLLVQGLERSGKLSLLSSTLSPERQILPCSHKAVFCAFINWKSGN